MKDFILNLDRPRKLKFGFKASRLLKEIFGKKDIDALTDMGIDEFPKVAWCGLVWEDANLTIEQAEELIDEKIPSEYTVTSFITLISEAVAAHMGVDLKKMGKAGQKKKKTVQPTGMIPSRRSGKQRSQSA